MMWFVKFMQKRPSDNTIRISRVLFGLTLIWSLYYNLIYQGQTIESTYFWMEVNESYLEYIKYFFIALWVFPLFMWITNMCVLQKKYIRYSQIAFWILLFYISSKIVEWPALDVDSLIAVMWIIPLLVWITWKWITSSCMRYGEKITKIRV